jgi:hypothetical protein
MSSRKKATPRSRKNTRNKVKTRKGLSIFAVSRVRSLSFILIVACVGSYFLYKGFAANNGQVGFERAVVPFREEPSRGLHWAGLKANPKSALCGGELLEVIDNTGKAIACTHGPDPAPEGVNVKTSAKPVVTGEFDRTAQEAVTSSETTSGTGSLTCEGDGVSGKRIEILYVHASDVASRYGTYASSFQTWASNTNNVYVESGLKTGEARHLRFVTDNNCNAVVTDVTIPATSDDNFSSTVSAVKNMGYNRTDRKYLLLVDSTVYCGISGIRYDDSAGTSNSNNGGPSYSRVDSGCWGLYKSVEAHEIMHSIGGVQLSAPHSSGGGHCTDEYDRMCYTDAQGLVMTYPCASTSLDRLFDCNNDDYFHTNPLPGAYLATHWNPANSVFLIGGGTETTPPPPTGDITAPVVSISSPSNGATIGSNTKINVKATDDTRIAKLEIYVDGILKASSSKSSLSYGWSSRKASTGAHTITAKAYDAAGNVGQTTITVYR